LWRRGDDASIDRVSPAPLVVIIAGPNGAGKSTVAHALLRDALGIMDFVNADNIARGLSGFNPEGAAVAAGRVMLARLRELGNKRVSFGFETTLASRSFAPWLVELKGSGYRVDVVFLWLSSPDMAVRRVADRVRMGGQTVPEDAIRRRYRGGIRNFFELYRPIASHWRFYDSTGSQPRLIAQGGQDGTQEVYDEYVWQRVIKEHSNGKTQQ
jgi:predicted ABC-type ATPase